MLASQAEGGGVSWMLLKAELWYLGGKTIEGSEVSKDNAMFISRKKELESEIKLSMGFGTGFPQPTFFPYI